MKVTISLGAASSEHLDHSVDRLYAAADTALYEAKSEGRNRVRWAAALRPDSNSATNPSPPPTDRR